MVRRWSGAENRFCSELRSEDEMMKIMNTKRLLHDVCHKVSLRPSVKMEKSVYVLGTRMYRGVLTSQQ